MLRLLLQQLKIIYPTIVGLGTITLGPTPRTFFKRRTDTRSGIDKTYRLRYVIPANSGGSVARPPTEGFILQESNTTIAPTNTEVQTFFGSGSLANVNQQRNFRFIAGAEWDSVSTTATIDTDVRHGLKVGSLVQIQNIKSSENTSGTDNSGFNGLYSVTGISSAKVLCSNFTDPGTFTSNTSDNQHHSHFRRKILRHILRLQTQ